MISFLHDGADVFFYSQPNTPKLRNIAHSPLVSLHLQSDPFGDHMLVIEGTAEIDPTIPPLDTHERYVAKYTRAARALGARLHPDRARLQRPDQDPADARAPRLIRPAWRAVPDRRTDHGLGVRDRRPGCQL